LTSHDQQPGRPLSVTLLALVVLIYAVQNLVRLVETIRQWDFLRTLLPFSPVYLLVTGFAWAGAGFWIFWGLWRGQSRARTLTMGLAPVSILHYWLDRLLFVEPGSGVPNTPFALVLSAIFLAATYWILSRDRAMRFFRS
jgi:hypothetical protein